LQGNRFLELLATHPIEVFLMNTGRVGGKGDDKRSKKVQIPDSSAIVQAIAEDTIKWTDAPDFGLEVAEDVPGIDDVELLQPWRLYEQQGRTDEYRQIVERLTAERRDRLSEFPELGQEITRAVG
jgi:phosphoenolpyruvate carboxykinase (ATP)